MNIPIRNKGRAIAWIYTICISVFALLPQDAVAVVETVIYTMNPDDIEFYKTDSDEINDVYVYWKGKVKPYPLRSALYDQIDYVYFLVPCNAYNFQVSASIVPNTGVIYQYDYIIATAQQKHDFQTYANDIQSTFGTTSYGYPTKAYAKYVDDGFIFGDLHVVRVAVHPFYYSSDSDYLRVENVMQINLEYDICEGNELYDTPLHPIQLPSQILEDISNFNFINKETATNILTSHGEGVSINSNRHIMSYQIIVPDYLKESVEDLETWKKQKGYNVSIRTIESILSDPKYRIGAISSISKERIVDEACALRAYLQNEFVKNGPFFCFLIGDWRTNMPIRKYWKNIYQENTPEYTRYKRNFNGEAFLPSDDYFSDLTSKVLLTNEKTDYGHYSGIIEKGVYPDIFLGRLLCSTSQEIKNYFEKLRIYESYPGKGADTYLTSALYFENNPKCRYHSDSSSLVTCSEIALKELDIFDDIIYAQDKDTNVGIMGHASPISGSDIIRYMRRRGFNSWLGHGHPAGILTCGGNRFIIPLNSYTPGLNGQIGRDVDITDKPNGLDMMDNENYPSITYSGACAIAPFDRMEELHHIFDIPYNMAGAYTVAGKWGGVAIIANSRPSYYPGVMDLQLEFSKQIKRTPKLGMAHYLSKGFCCTNDLETGKLSNLIGDPEFEMWLNRPYDFMPTQNQNKVINPVLTNPNLEGAEYIIYNGNTVSYRAISDGRVPDLPSRFDNYLPMISIWKSRYLPSLTLYAQEGTITNINAKYLPHNAYFGITSNTSTSKRCVIGDNANIDIDVMKSIKIYDGFSVEDGGRVDIKCHEDIRASGELVRVGGEVNLTGTTVILAPGFKVELGGKLQISTF